MPPLPLPANHVFSWKLAATTALWLVAVLGGIAALNRYKATPGASKAAPAAWPADARLVAPVGAPKLLVLAHPRCTCTRATLAELDKLVRAAPKALEVEVIFIRPEGTPEGFARDSELWARAEAIPGVRVREDKDRVEARRFGATTSGQVLLYGVDGGLAFAGGITGARGHEGPNAGADRLLALLRGKGAPAQAPTFGCDLNDPQLPGAPL